MTDQLREARGGCDKCRPCIDFGCNTHEDVTGRHYPLVTPSPDTRNAVPDEVMEVVYGVPTFGDARILGYRSGLLNRLLDLRTVETTND